MIRFVFVLCITVAAVHACQSSDGVLGEDYIVITNAADETSCCAQCSTRSDCRAWTFDTSGSRTCYLKDNTRSPKKEANRRSGVPQRNLPVIGRACSEPDSAQRHRFCDTSLSVDERVRDLISQIQANEKPPLLTARESPNGNISRLGLPEYDWGANCIHGVQSHCGTRCATSFPSPNALGAAFNSTLIRDMGRVIGIELRSLWLQGVTENNAHGPHLGLDCWSPNINVNRDPRWGRNQEVASEDPFVLGTFGAAYTLGLQFGEDPRYLQAVVTLKHWDAYSLESYGNVSRHNFNAIVSPYMFQDTYFPAWRASVQEGKAKGVMCSYNSVNGVPACASSFLNRMLRDVWGFDGYITSDSGAIQDIYAQHHYVKTPEEAACLAIRDGGCDINSGSVYNAALLKAVSEGLCNMTDVDLALYRTLKLRFELGLMDPIENQPYWHVPPEAVNTEESQALNLLATHQSIVLLQNEMNTLPFTLGKRVAVIGPHANASQALVGNYLGEICPDGSFSCVVSPFLAIQKLNIGGQTVLSPGCEIDGSDSSKFAAAVAAAESADYVVLALGIDQSIEREGYDRVSIDLPLIQHMLSAKILAVGKPTVVVLINGGMVAIAQEKAAAPAIIEAFYPGFHGGTALADVIFGKYNPGGKLPITIYKADYVNQVDMYNMDMAKAPGRSYKYFTGEPLWPFGYGLSYTRFKLTSNDFSASEVRHLTSSSTVQAVYVVNVTNIGDRDGDEVVLAFFKPNYLPMLKENPVIKQLYGFQRVNVKVGETVTVQFEPDAYKLSLVDDDGNRVSTPGSYTLIFTNGVEEILTTTIEITGEHVVLERFPSKLEK